MSTIPTSPPEPQDAQDPVAGALAVIVVAVLDFFRPTILGPSWIPWVRAMCAFTVLAVAVVAVVLAVQLT